MKTGKTLSQLAAEIERQSTARKDYLADTRNLEVIPAATVINGKPATEPRLVLQNGERSILAINDQAHRQIAERVGIPAKYYERMRLESPDLLANNVNHWFKTNPEDRMVRTLDNKVRAFLSNRYQRIDNNHVAEVVLPVLMETPGIEVVSAEITESRLYIKAVTHKVRGEVKSKRVGDVVEAGVIISNSEIGLGAVTVSPFFMFLWCLNGMVRAKDGMRSAHLGTKLDTEENIASLLADDTRKSMDRTVLLKVRDVVRAAMDAAKFQQAIEAMNESTTQVVKGNPAKAIELLSEDFGINEGEQSSILRHLIEGGDLSRYGVMNAVTRTAEDLESYDRATEFETMGGRILDLSASSWNRIAEAA